MKPSLRTLVLASLLAFAQASSPAMAGEADSSTAATPMQPAPSGNARQQGERAITSLLEQLRKEDDPARAEALRSRLTTAWTAAGPASAQALLKEAARAQADGLIDTARRLYDLVVRRWPQYEDGHFRRALFLWQLEKDDAALAELDDLLARNPDYFPALVLRIHILRRARRLREALRACDRLRVISPRWDAWHNRCRRMRLKVRRDA